MTNTDIHPAIPQFDGDNRSTREEQVIDSIVGEVMAQLEELSDDTWALLPDGEADPLHEMADDLRLTLMVTVRQRLSDWVCDNETAATALYDSDWHKAITSSGLACQWCNGTGCQSCGFTGRGDTHDEGCTGLPCTCEG